MKYVIQPITSKSDPEWVETATIISYHLTERGAVESIRKATAALRRQPGMAASWLDWHVVDGHELSHQKRASYVPPRKRATFETQIVRNSSGILPNGIYT